MVVLFYIIFNKSAYGHKVKAVGSNQVIAQNAGINIMKIKVRGFIFGGVFVGVAAVLYLSNTKVMMVPAMLGSVNLIFNAMMGIFIAFFLQRYCNFVFGIVIGTLSMQILTSGLVALGISGTLQNITSGLFLLVLLIVSSNQGIFSSRKRIKQYTDLANTQYDATHNTKS
jgi:ribose/xylose/arabinose/galactoside ABC-type transport system permease subunit